MAEDRITHALRGQKRNSRERKELTDPDFRNIEKPDDLNSSRYGPRNPSVKQKHEDDEEEAERIEILCLESGLGEDHGDHYTVTIWPKAESADKKASYEKEFDGPEEVIRFLRKVL